MKQSLILTSIVFLSLPVMSGPVHPSAKQDLEARVQKLEAAQKILVTDLALVTRQNQELRAWASSIPAICEKLDQRMDSSRKNGFEYAGAHPRAKKDILDGLKSFAAGLSKGLVKPTRK